MQCGSRQPVAGEPGHTGIDNGIHTHSVGDADNLRDIAVANAEKRDGDVIRSQRVIVLTDALDSGATGAAFRAAGLEPRLEIAAGRFAFRQPDEARYHTQSQPR